MGCGCSILLLSSSVRRVGRVKQRQSTPSQLEIDGWPLNSSPFALNIEMPMAARDGVGVTSTPIFYFISFFKGKSLKAEMLLTPPSLLGEIG